MSKAAFERMVQTGKVLEGFQTLHKLVDEAPMIQLSEAGLARWEELQREYDAFYELSIDERVKFSQINEQPK